MIIQCYTIIENDNFEMLHAYSMLHDYLIVKSTTAVEYEPAKAVMALLSS